MTGTENLVGVACQLGDCSNPAALTVTVELPTSWSEEREYTTRTLLVAVCGECAPAVEQACLALLAARVQFASRLGKARLLAQLVGLIEAVGPPFKPEPGGIFARWLADLDQPSAQGAWSLLAHIKRTRGSGRPPDEPTTPGRHRRAANRPPAMEDASGRPVLLRPSRGGDDAA